MYPLLLAPAKACFVTLDAVEPAFGLVEFVAELVAGSAAWLVVGVP